VEDILIVHPFCTGICWEMVFLSFKQFYRASDLWLYQLKSPFCQFSIIPVLASSLSRITLLALFLNLSTTVDWSITIYFLRIKSTHILSPRRHLLKQLVPPIKEILAIYHHHQILIHHAINLSRSFILSSISWQ